MGELKKLDQLTEFQLTNAIQKAASMSLGSDRDRSQILAQQLDQADIPKHLTKLAAQAFNRRLTVITLGKRDEDTKADSFPLADINKTAKLRGCEQEMEKTASVKSGKFQFTFVPAAKPVMTKVASADPAPEITVGQFMKKLAAAVDRAVADIEIQARDLMHQQAVLEKMHKKASDILKADTKTSNLFSTVYGQKYTKLFPELGEQALQKYAAFAFLPETEQTAFVKSTIAQHDKVQELKKAFIEKRASTETLAKEASQIETKYNEQRLKGLIKESNGYDVVKNLALNSVSIPLIMGAKLGQGAVSGTADFLSGTSKYLSRDYAKHPSSVITGALMNTDKADDKAARLIDMLADRDLKDYPAEDIESAVEKVLIQQPAFLSPRYREHLKTAVTQRLLQGGKTNAADQAAMATTMKALTQTDEARRSNSASEVLSRLSQKRTKGDSAFGSLLSLAEVAKKELSGSIPNSLFVSGTDKVWDDFRNDIKQDVKDKQKLKILMQKQMLKDMAQGLQARKAEQELRIKERDAHTRLLTQLAMGGLKHNPGLYSGFNTQGKNHFADYSLSDQQRLLQIAGAQWGAMSPEDQAAYMATHTKK